MGKAKDVFYWPRKKKREATKFWANAASSEYDKGQAHAKRSGVYHRYMEHLHKSNAVAYYGAQAAADLAPENLATLALDIASLGQGSAVSRGVGGALRLLKATKAAKARPAVQRALQGGQRLARDWSNPASKLYKGRKATKLGTTAGRSLSSQGTASPDQPPSPPHREPFRQISPQVRPDTPSKPKLRARPRRTRRPPQGPSYSLLDPVKIADWSLRHGAASPRKAPDKPFMSTVDRLRHLERQAADREKTQRWLKGVERSLQQGIRPQTGAERRAMEKRYGVDAIARNTPPFKPKSAPLAPQDQARFRDKFGQNANRSRPSPTPSVNPLRDMAKGLF